MLRFLLQRPIAVTMVLIVSLAVSLIAYLNIPISLLPSIDVPEITVSIAYPNTPAEEIEENVLKPIRESMLTINGLTSIESIARQESGLISLRLEYGTEMDLAYIEVNEKIDRINSMLPRNLERPQVVKVNTSDIPILRIQVMPRTSEEYIAVSKLVSNVLKRRLEQVPGVGLVDINGGREAAIFIEPNYPMLKTLGLGETAISQVIEKANSEFGSLKVRDGNYQYFLKLSSSIDDPKQLETLPVKIPGTNSFVQLKDIASISIESEEPAGYHIFNSQDGVVVTIHKQAQARMTELTPKLYDIVDELRNDYPGIDFDITQDQSILLSLSIQNLSQSLIWGGIFAFGVLFLFMGGWREPFVMGIILPVSLVLSMSLLYLFDISLNIISLSGLALGLGMLVDNSIVVIDNIVMKRNSGLDLIESCIFGTREVMPPLLSSALTNLAVFVPMIFISGLAGALFLDQAIAVTCILFVSILCTYVLVPLLYMLFYRSRTWQVQDDSQFFKWLKNKYHQSFLWVWNHKLLCTIGFTALIPVSVILLIALPKQGFPDIERNESILKIDWNEPIDAKNSRTRITDILPNFPKVATWEAEVAHKDFVLIDDQQSAPQATVYMKFNSSLEKEQTSSQLQSYLRQNFPKANVQIKNAPNAFEQLFDTNIPLYEIRFRNPIDKKTLPFSFIDSLNQRNELQGYTVGRGFEMESMVYLVFDFSKMQLYQVEFEDLNKKLQIIFGDYLIAGVKNFGEIVPIKFKGTESNLESALQEQAILSKNGETYALKEFVKTSFSQTYKNITADAGGVYQSILTNQEHDEPLLREHWTEVASEKNVVAELFGGWIESKANMKSIFLILVISFVLMYFIITAEFESFTMPVIVMLSIPIGIAGSLILLWSTGGSLNIMSGIGLVVVLGILDNDAILKIDRINTLRETLPLNAAIEQAGLDRLKPIVMNTCTNVLAVTPIVFSSGLGADLQKPVAIATIGGLIVATLTALYFIPVVYWFFSKKTANNI